MRARPYLIYDVFTDTPLAGNPLAIVLDGEGLDAAQMQRIAGEFNLSETVFLTPAENPVHTRRVRIFTPQHELPFAGHPTVGTAIALAELAKADGEQSRPALILLEETIGPVRCAVSSAARGSFCEFDLPRLPERIDIEVLPELAAAALGLSPHEVGFENHTVAVWSAGVPFVCVPIANLRAAAKARLDPQMWRELVPDVNGIQPNAYIYCRESILHDSAFHVRMFAQGLGISEDPATGSAAAAFAGAVVESDEPLDGIHCYWIEQGMEMGRPSRIRLEVEVEGGRIRGARIGGGAVKVVEGTLFV
ncbi:isomerase [Nitratireductor aestuarii]|uniref:Isomerase n=1 Tax=Nitratireductor aestuarii TaxID=1735103 RepID=A0A916RFJ5_9HYPH|nr:PhzF family phenazine biosynthesis protein [Nitratireductor aestuarii]GGA52340.1 isomerase [Nitratireductor aestuarii]